MWPWIALPELGHAAPARRVMGHHDGDAVERLCEFSLEIGAALVVQVEAVGGRQRALFLPQTVQDADHLEIVHGVVRFVHHARLLVGAEQGEIGPERGGDDADRRAVRVQVSRSSMRTEEPAALFRCAAMEA
jgi:hypothetical protein